MTENVRKWVQVGLINLAIVAFLGSILRYKIAFSLPFIHQKHLLHGHSHFAFAGWVTQVLMLLLLLSIGKIIHVDLVTKHKRILYANLITAYGMLIAFPIQGYGLVSIGFSTLSIFVFYWFTIVVFKEIKNAGKTSIAFYWYKMALLLGILSSIGAFLLAFLMATLYNDQNAYLLAVYGYLHFQYNGWFFFAVMGLFMQYLATLTNDTKNLKKIFWMFAIASIPAYFLSALWLKIPTWVYVIVVISSVLQAWGLFDFIKIIKQQKQHFTLKNRPGNILLLLALIAFSIKVLLQLFSTIPILSQIAFGYRSIVIGYLHLMLLGVISLSIIAFLINEGLVNLNTMQKRALWIFVIGVIVNQILLMVQGLAGMLYIYIPFVNELLFVAAVTMFTGLFIFNYKNKQNLTIQ